VVALYRQRARVAVAAAWVRDPEGTPLSTSRPSKVATTDDWVITLGTAHGARERAAVQTAGTARDERAAMAALALERWTHIVAAMTRLVSAYNVSFGRDILRAAEDRSDATRPVMTISSGDEGSPSLVAALEGTLICVCSRGTQGLLWDVQRPLVAGRDDDQTAAYILQQWMEQL
jgi:hypothetical protein